MTTHPVLGDLTPDDLCGDLIASTYALMQAGGQFTPDTPVEPGAPTTALRLAMLLEEVDEYCQAVGTSLLDVTAARASRPGNEAAAIRECLPGQDHVNLPELADAHADIAVIAAGGLLEAVGPWTAPRILAAVNTANLHKIRPDGTVHRRPDGKIGKPAGWQPPDVHGIIRDAQQ